MDVEGTIEILLQHGARLDARQDRFDRQLRVLAQLGMRVSRRAFSAIEALAEQQRKTDATLDRVAEQQRQTEAAFDRVAEQQRETEARLNAVIALFERHLSEGRNGGPPAA